MTQSPSQSRRTRKDIANRSLGGLAVYAAVIPLMIAVLAVPAMVGAFALGISSAVGVSWLRGRLSQANNSTKTHSSNLV
jgi:hypothetical protein